MSRKRAGGVDEWNSVVSATHSVKQAVCVCVCVCVCRRIGNEIPSNGYKYAWDLSPVTPYMNVYN